MRKILYAVVLLSVITAGGFLGYQLRRSTPKSGADYLEAGRKYFQEKKYSEATIQFLNASQRSPQHRDAPHLLTSTYI